MNGRAGGGRLLGLQCTYVPLVSEHGDDDVAVDVVDGVIERTLIVRVLHSDVGVVLEQQLDRFHVPAETRIVQSCILHAARSPNNT